MTESVAEGVTNRSARDKFGDMIVDLRVSANPNLIPDRVRELRKKAKQLAKEVLTTSEKEKGEISESFGKITDMNPELALDAYNILVRAASGKIKDVQALLGVEGTQIKNLKYKIKNKDFLQSIAPK